MRIPDPSSEENQGGPRTYHTGLQGIIERGCCCEQAGKTELLTRLQRLLKTWAPLLQKFLRSEDDQVCYSL